MTDIPDDVILTAFRLYAPAELGADGYPRAWHEMDTAQLLPWCREHGDLPSNGLGDRARVGLKELVRAEAANRCVRCLHPYVNGEHGNGEWSPCDARCVHDGPFGARSNDSVTFVVLDGCGVPLGLRDQRIYARWRVLTVHHLDMNKANCRWWNLVPLCQRDHLYMQGKVVMDRPFILEHSDWFKIYAAGFYAHKYFGEDLTRPEAEARLDELLACENLAQGAA